METETYKNAKLILERFDPDSKKNLVSTLLLNLQMTPLNVQILMFFGFLWRRWRLNPLAHLRLQDKAKVSNQVCSLFNVELINSQLTHVRVIIINFFFSHSSEWNNSL